MNSVTPPALLRRRGAALFRPIALCAGLGLASSAVADWEALGPGGGGQIQGIHFDPGTPGRGYFMMDVEGLYRTDDGGQSWLPLPRNNVCAHTFEVATKPDAPGTVYLGTFWGPLISTDTGANWALTGSAASPGDAAYQLRNNVIGTLAVDPRRPALVYAAPNWRVQTLSFNVLRLPQQASSGPRYVYFSPDSGATWARSQYEATDGWKQVYSVVPDPADVKVAWVAAHSGLYRGVRANEAATTFTWTRVAGPARSESDMDGNAELQGRCFGLEFSPDGQFAYATWGVDKPDQDPGTPDRIQKETITLSLPFIARVSELLANPAVSTNWRPLAAPEHKGQLFVPDDDTPWGDDTGLTFESKGNLLVLDMGINYWRPSVDPRSTATRHKVLVGEMTIGGRAESGLFEGDFAIEVTGPGPAWSVTGKWVRIFAASGQQNTYNNPTPGPSPRLFGYDFGWQNLTSRARHYRYSPASWPQREIWVAADQNLYRINTLDFADPVYPQDASVAQDFYGDWVPLTTSQVSVLSGRRTFTHRGITSTVDYDATASGNYYLAVGADNAMYESYDNGASVIMSQALAVGSGSGLGQGDSALVATIGPNTYALAGQLANVFGGGTGTELQDLYAKRLVANNPTDPWYRLAGGANGLAGLRRLGLPQDPVDDPATPSTNEGYLQPGQGPRILAMAQDPVNTNRVYLSTVHGVYVIDDFEGLFNEMKAQADAGTSRANLVASRNWVRKIFTVAGETNPNSNVQYKQVFVNPVDATRVYFATRNRVVRLLRAGDGSYTSIDLYTSAASANNVSDFAYWRNGADNYFAIGAPSTGQGLKLGAPWIENGTLERVFTRSISSPHAHYLCWRTGTMDRWECAAFAEWLQKSVGLAAHQTLAFWTPNGHQNHQGQTPPRP